VLVVRIPQSWAGPHRVKSNQHFFIREGLRKRQLDMPEIRGLFLRSDQQAQKIRDFRTERLGKLLAGEAPHPLMPGPLLVVHLIPTQAALGLVQVDPVAYTRTRTLPALATTVPGARVNLDGALGLMNYASGGAHGYTLFFRNGFFETVKVLTSRLDNGRINLASKAYEQEIITLVARCRAELQHIGVGQEMSCMLSLTDAESVQLGIDVNDLMDLGSQPKFDRRTLVLPDVLLPADMEPGHALRPVFDLVWQSAGMHGSINYNANGEWAPRR
jgi:hypothetical protein